MKKYKLDGQIKREYTEEEYAQSIIDEQNYEAELKTKNDAAKELSEKKIAAEAKLAALGLTADDLKALGIS